MRFATIILFAFLLSFQTSPASAQTRRNTPAPVFSIQPASLDVGAVKKGEAKTDTVTVTNTGTGSLFIYQVISDNPEFTFTPETGSIAASAKMEFYITFAPLTPGPKSANIVFLHGASLSDTLKVKAKTAGTPEFALSTNSIDFGIVQTGVRKTDSVVVTNSGWDVLHISSIYITNTVFTVSPSGGDVEPGTPRTFFVTFYPLQSDQYAAALTFRHNITGRTDTVSLHGTGTGPPAKPVLQLSRSQIVFDTTQTGSTRTDSVIITNAGNAPLKIFNAWVYDARFSCSPNSNIILQANASTKLLVSFTPDVPKVIESYIIFWQDASHTDTVKLRGAGYGDSLVPKFSMSKTQMDFDTLLTGLTKRDSVLITNAGQKPLQVSAVTVSPADCFSVSPSSFSLGPAQTRWVLVSFTPLSDGLKTATLNFSHNAAGADSVLLRGIGAGGVPVAHFALLKHRMDYGNVTVKAAGYDSLIVANSGRKSLTVNVAIESGSGKFGIFPKSFTLGIYESKALRFYFAPSVPGPDSARIILTHDAPEPPDTAFAFGNGISSSSAPMFRSDPAELDFGLVSIESHPGIADTLIFTNTGDADLKIQSLSCGSPLFTITPSYKTLLPPDSSTKVEIIYMPTAVGEVNAELQVDLNTAVRYRWIPLHGACDSTAHRAILGLAPKSIDFRGTLVNTNTRKFFTISNYGQDTLIVSSIHSPTYNFWLSDTSGSVPPLSKKIFDVSFGTNVPSEHSANLIIRSNARKKYDTLIVQAKGVKVNQIVNVKSFDEGTDVAFEGIVTRAKGAYIRVEDPTGAITVKDLDGELASAVSSGAVAMGDSVRILGSTLWSTGRIIIPDGMVNGYSVLARNRMLPVPMLMDLKHAWMFDAGKESRLVSVPGISIVGSPDMFLSAGVNYTIVDESDSSGGVTLAIPNEPDTWIVGKPIAPVMNFTGIICRDLGGYQLIPILETDLMDINTGVGDPDISADGFDLSAFPNPFLNAATLRYTVPETGPVLLRMYDLLGRPVGTLVDGTKNAGQHTVSINGSGLPRGTYIVVMQTKGGVRAMKIMLER